MIAVPILARHIRAARWRVVLDTLAVGAPAVLAIGALAWRLSAVPVGLALVAAALLGVAGIAARRARRFDAGWLIGRLDAGVPAFEDSSALLFAPPSASGGLAALQRGRLEARIALAEPLDLRPDWSRRAIAGAWAMAAALVAAVLLWPDPARETASTQAVAARAPTGPPRIVAARLLIVPPAYTGLPAREQAALDARVPEGSRIEWTIRFRPEPDSARIAVSGGGTVPLTPGPDGWRAASRVDRPTLYRIEGGGVARQRLRRLDVIADTPPVVRVVMPDGQLATAVPGQRRWTPVFEATDDHGVAAAATMRITVSQGDGENISFTQRTVTIRGGGAARARRFAPTLDLAREGLAPGGDLIVQIVVADDRAAGQHVVEGPSAILRRPAELALADGMDGMAQRVMPAYFRSQRQIIIDAQALLAERSRLDPARFVDRSNALGDDQAQLRARYGQFMGEDAGGGGGGEGIAIPTNDAPAPAAPEADHDHAGEGAPPLGTASELPAEFVHAHDTGDAATLFDPGTRSTLAQALDAMWASERALRQGEPRAALPFAERALELLKSAQQATRVFVARTAAALPPIDLSRRLSGKREGIVAAPLAPISRPPADTVVADAWRALGDRPGGVRSAPLRLGALDRWVAANRTRLPDPLALAAAIDTVRGEPGCAACRERLRALLWSTLERPTAAIGRRAAAGARGRRYLDALR